MFLVDKLLLLGAILLLIGIVSSKFSSRLGLPVLVLFLGVGMLAGSEGIGQIAFENYSLAHGIGTVALAIILFDGGLRTSISSFRSVLGPAIVMSTLGVITTSVITGLAASYFMGISLLEGMLLGSIIGSTDAAAVFSVLRGRGLNLRERIASTLEVESGANDPMAVFLTIGLLEILLGRLEIGPALIGFLGMQMIIGAVAGLVIGRLAVALINRIDLDAAGLYPILATAAGLLAFGAAAVLGGSGILSVYLAGIVIGNSRIVFQRGILAFHDAGAWLSQLTMFVVLGLLSFPSKLASVAGEGLLIAAVLILVARPLTVMLLLLPFRYSFAELVFISWVGLKGAVPVVLATYPLMQGLPGADRLFNVVFFVVLVSALLQGWTMPPLARRLGLRTKFVPDPPVSLEITSLKQVDSDIVDYTVTADSRAAGRSVRDLMLPDGTVIAMIVRGQQAIPPRGRTQIEAGDHVFLLLQTHVRPLVDRIFSRTPLDATTTLPARTEFLLRGDTTVEALAELYGLHLDAPANQTLDALLRERLGNGAGPACGDAMIIGGVELRVREMLDGYVEQIGLSILPTNVQPSAS